MDESIHQQTTLELIHPKLVNKTRTLFSLLIVHVLFLQLKQDILRVRFSTRPAYCQEQAMKKTILLGQQSPKTYNSVNMLTIMNQQMPLLRDDLQ
jgi:hypothetical protein